MGRDCLESRADIPAGQNEVELFPADDASNVKWLERRAADRVWVVMSRHPSDAT